MFWALENQVKIFLICSAVGKTGGILTSSVI